MIIEDFYKNREPRVYDETAPTIRAEREGLKVIEEQPVIIGGMQKNQSVKTDGICPTLMAGEPAVHRIESPYRIRKLAPKECWRLMGFTDEDFHKAEQVNSNTQLYKQAGNSIVVKVLESIFKQMLKEE